MPELARKGEEIFRGLPVSAGVCQGKILLLGKSHAPIPHRQLLEAELAEEVNRLERALSKTRQEILDFQHRVSTGMKATDGGIFDAHLLVLEDRTLLDEVIRMIHEQKVNVEYAFHKVAERYAAYINRNDPQAADAFRSRMRAILSK